MKHQHRNRLDLQTLPPSSCTSSDRHLHPRLCRNIATKHRTIKPLISPTHSLQKRLLPCTQSEQHFYPCLCLNIATKHRTIKPLISPPTQLIEETSISILVCVSTLQLNKSIKPLISPQHSLQKRLLPCTA